MTNEEIFDIIRPVILLVTGVPECILANPNDDAPNGPYCSVQPTQNIREYAQGRIVRNCENDIFTEDVRAQVIAECSINFYRKGALDFPKKLLRADRRSDAKSMLLQANLGWFRTSDIRNLTALQSARQEPRSQISIFLAYETSNPFEIDYIERVLFSVENQQKSTLIDTGIKQ